MKTASTAAVAAVVALLASGCGASSPPSTTSAPSFQSLVSNAYKYAACMRDHGATNFPDPKVTNNGSHQSIAIQAVGPNSPQFKAAVKACHSILPGPSNADLAAQAAERRAHTRDLLSFARCMRGRGVNEFPDPGAQGQLTLAMITAAGVDLHAPQVAAAARACVPASHGALTPAAVAQATGSTG